MTSDCSHAAHTTNNSWLYIILNLKTNSRFQVLHSNSVWKRPETPLRVNEATNIQMTVIDNQQQFLYIHSTACHLPAATCWTLQSLSVEMVIFGWTVSKIALHLPLIRSRHTPVMLLIVWLCYVLLNKSWVEVVHGLLHVCLWFRGTHLSMKFNSLQLHLVTHFSPASLLSRNIIGYWTNTTD